MSEIKNDPRGIKQVIAGVLLTLAGMLVLVFSGNGALLTCNSQNECNITRRDVFGTSSDQFRWNEVIQVSTSDAVQGASRGSSNRGVISHNITLLFHSDKSLRVFASGVGWLKGDLDLRNLAAHVGGPAPTRLSGISLGGASWAVSAMLGGVGFVLLLMNAAVKIVPGMEVGALSNARRQNLMRLALMLSGAILLWAGLIYCLFKWFGIE